MTYNDYVVMIDENGQPYIAHSRFGDAARNFGSAAKNTAHKYLDKALVGGKWVYAYTQQELEALRRGGGRVKAKVKDKLGYDERDRRDAARRNLEGASNALTNASGGYSQKAQNVLDSRRSEFNRAQDEYSKTALGKYEYLKAALKVRGHLAANTIKRYGKTTLAAIRSLPSRAGSLATNAGNAIGSAVNAAARYVPGTKQNKAYKAMNAAQERGQRDTERAQRQQTQAAVNAAQERGQRDTQRAQAQMAQPNSKRGTVRTPDYSDYPVIEPKTRVVTAGSPAIERRQPKRKNTT